MLSPCPGNSSWSARALERSRLPPRAVGSSLWLFPSSLACGTCSVLLSLHCHSLRSAVLWLGWLLQRKGRRKGGKREGKEVCWWAWTGFLWGCQPGSARWGIDSLWVAGADPRAQAWLGFQGADASRGSWATPGLCWAVWPSQLFPCCFLSPVHGAAESGAVLSLLACFVSKHPCQGAGCSFCSPLALSKQRGSPGCPSGCWEWCLRAQERILTGCASSQMHWASFLILPRNPPAGRSAV